MGCSLYFNDGDKYLYLAKRDNQSSEDACKQLLHGAEYCKDLSDIDDILRSGDGILAKILAKAENERGTRPPSFLNNIVEIHWKCANRFFCERDQKKRIWESL